MTENPNKMRRRGDLRPLACIPHRVGYELIGVKKNGDHVILQVFLDESGNYTVAGYEELTGWKLYG